MPPVMIGAHTSCFEIPPRYECNDSRTFSSRRNGRLGENEVNVYGRERLWHEPIISPTASTRSFACLRSSGFEGNWRQQRWGQQHVATLLGLRPIHDSGLPNVACGNVGLEDVTASRFSLRTISP